MDVPRTLLVTNDYPPRVGGIQRTLEALVRSFPADRVAVLCPDWDGRDARSTRPRPTRCSASPSASCGRSPTCGAGCTRPFGRSGRRWCCSAPPTRSPCSGPGWRAAGTPYLAAAHGFEYWLSIAPGTHALMRRRDVAGLARAGDVQRVHRAHRPNRRAAAACRSRCCTRGRISRSSGPDLPTADLRELPRRRRPSADRVREPAGRAQGAGRADPRDARGSADASPTRRC